MSPFNFHLQFSPRLEPNTDTDAAVQFLVVQLVVTGFVDIDVIRVEQVVLIGLQTVRIQASLCVQVERYVLELPLFVDLQTEVRASKFLVAVDRALLRREAYLCTEGQTEVLERVVISQLDIGRESLTLQLTS